MKLACIEGIAALARATTSAEAAAAYKGEQLTFGADYLIPKPFDPRLIGVVASAVAKAAMETGVATSPIDDLEAYRQKLDGSVFRSALIMRPVFEAARQAERRIVFAEGEDERVLRAANAMMEEMTDHPILIGRPEVISARCERAGLPIRPDRDFEMVNPENDARYRDYWGSYHDLMARRGVTPDIARAVMRTNSTAIAAIAVHRGDADSMICGTFGQYLWHLNYVNQVLGRGGLPPHGALSLMILEDGPLVRRRHSCQRGAHARTDRHHRYRGRPPCPPFRRDAEGGALFAFQFRQSGQRIRAQDARCPGYSGRQRRGFRV